MKTYIFSAMMLCGLATAQTVVVQRQPFPTDNRPVTGEEWRLSLIERLMSLPSPVTSGAVQLYGMGDEAAVDVLKILGTKSSLSNTELQAILDIVHTAFQHPESIMEPVNQKPRAVLLLLQHLASTTSDSLLTERITKEREFLQSAIVPSAPSSSAVGK